MGHFRSLTILLGILISYCGASNSVFLLARTKVLTPTQNSTDVTVEYAGFTFVLKQCKISGGDAVCVLSVTSNDEDRSITVADPVLLYDKSRLVDNNGNEYRLRETIFGNQRDSARLVAGVHTRLVVKFSGLGSGVTELSALRLLYNSSGRNESWALDFRKIPMYSGASSDNQDRPSPSVNDVAFRKPVFITTNGADDVSDAGDRCNTSSEVTDGYLFKTSGNCADDGVIGFQNHDYNELMEVTVTINLQKRYNISKIRYNPGNVQRAESWNADLMITPFGRTRTTPGSPNTGAWTEQTGSLVASSVKIVFQKTRHTWNDDWLFIGEIEIIGIQTPAAPRKKRME